MRLAILLLSFCAIAGAAQTSAVNPQRTAKQSRTSHAEKRHRARSAKKKGIPAKKGEADRQGAAPQTNPLDPTDPDPMRPRVPPSANRPSTVPNQPNRVPDPTK